MEVYWAVIAILLTLVVLLVLLPSMNGNGAKPPVPVRGAPAAPMPVRASCTPILPSRAPAPAPAIHQAGCHHPEDPNCVPLSAGYRVAQDPTMPAPGWVPPPVPCGVAGLSGTARQIQDEAAEEIDQAEDASEGLRAYYRPARPVIQDYPPKPVTDCPYVKPPSGPLPLADVPMCIAARPESLRQAPLAVSV